MTPRATLATQDDEASAAVRSSGVVVVAAPSSSPRESSRASSEDWSARWDDASASATATRDEDEERRLGRFLKTRARVDAARALVRAGRCADAMRMLESTPARELGGEAIALAIRGEVRERVGETELAFRAFRASRDADGNPDAWCGLARLAHGAGALEEAVACFRTARDGYEALGCERDAEETSARLARAWTDLATTFKARGDAVSAEETYREIIARLPRHAAAAYYNLGVALVEAGRLDEAECAYRDAPRRKAGSKGSFGAQQGVRSPAEMEAGGGAF